MINNISKKNLLDYKIPFPEKYNFKIDENRVGIPLRIGVFGILLTATILTIFEICFFYFVVLGGVEKSSNNGYNELSRVLLDNFNQKKKTFIDIIENTNNELDKNLISSLRNKINILKQFNNSGDLENTINSYLNNLIPFNDKISKLKDNDVKQIISINNSFLKN